MQGNICLFGAALQAAWPNRSKKEYPEKGINPSTDDHGKFLFVMNWLSPLYITQSCFIHQASLETRFKKKALWSWTKAVFLMPHIHIRTDILFSITTLIHTGMTVLVLQVCTKNFREAKLSYFSKKKKYSPPISKISSVFIQNLYIHRKEGKNKPFGVQTLSIYLN